MLEINVTAKPPINISSWYRNNIELSNSTNKYKIGLTNIEIYNLTYLDYANFTLSAGNVVGQTNYTFLLNVQCKIY